MDDSKPSNLREALSVTPLLHLLPLQESAALIAPFSTDTSFQYHTNPRSSQLKDTINQNPDDFKDIIESMSQELKNYESEELDSLKFYKPNMSVSGKSQELHLTPLQQVVFDSSPVSSQQFKTQVFPSQSYDSRLSIRKKYDSINKDHNLKYKQKFLKEYSPVKSVKRSTEEVMVLSNKIAKVETTTQFERVQDRLLQVMLSIGVNSDENVDNKSLWDTVDDKRFVSMEIMVEFFDCLTKLVCDPKVNQINTEIIMRIQGLMLKILAESKEIDFTTFVTVFDASQEIHKVFQPLFKFALAAKIMLVILTGNFLERKIYLDDYLASVVDFVYLLQNEIIIRLANKIFKPNVSSEFKPMISQLVEGVRYIFYLLSTYTSKYSIDESMQTRLEYLSFHTIEADMNRKEVSSLIGIESFSNMKISASDLLLEIFKTQSNQHPYILHDLVVGMDKHSSTRSIARQFKTAYGNKILLITVLFVRMVESVSYETATELAQNNENQDRETLLAKHKNALSMTKAFVDDITTSIVSRLIKNPEFKAHLDILVEDLLVLMPYPEWSGAEFLVTGFMKSFMLMTQNDNCKNVEPYIFDMLGKISESLIKLKQSSNAMDTNLSQTVAFQLNVTNVINHLQWLVNRNPKYLASFQFLCIKLLVDLNKMKQDNTVVHNDLDALNSVTEESQPENEILRVIEQTDAFVSNVIKNGSLTPLENIGTSYTGLILHGELPLLYENFLNITLLTLESSKIKSKSKAIRILSGLIDRDLDILNSQKLQDSIASKLLDKSPLVRDAVIDLISKFIMSNPELSKNFYKPICDCLNDSSIQVKRRVIKLAVIMYPNLNSKKAKVYVATKLLMALYDEEDSIAELVRSSIKDLLLGGAATIDNVEVLMDVVSLGGRITKQFEEYLRVAVLSNPNDKSLDAIIVTGLDNINDSTNRTQIEKGLKLISTIVKCDSKLITQEQLISLLPSLVEEGNHGNIIYYNLIILRRALPVAGALRPDYAQSVQNFLIQNLTKFNTKEMNEAMPCIWNLCEIKGNTIKLANASISCIKLIKPYLDKKQDVKPDAKLDKLIHLLGCFGTYCKLEEFRELYMTAALGFKKNESVISGIMKYLLFFCVGEQRVRDAAISNVINVCISHPKFFLSEPILKIFDNEFTTLDPLVIHTIITGFIKFLVMEEELSQRRNENDNVRATRSFNLAIFHGNSKSSMNDGVCASLVQKYMENILKLSVFDKGSLTVPCIEFLQLVVRLGFANPRVCIPTIIAFESSETPRIRKIAVSLHMELFEKHESLINTSYIEGIKQGMEYIKATHSSLVANQEFFQNIYEIVNSTNSSRKKFINSLAKVLRIEDDMQRDDLLFICTNIANMKLVTLEEGIILITKIDQILEEEGVEFYESVNSINELEQSQEIDQKIEKAQMFLAILQLRQVLVANYGMTTIQIDNFRPTRVDPELKQPLKLSGERRKFIIDVDNENGVEYIIQFLQGMKEYV